MTYFVSLLSFFFSSSPLEKLKPAVISSCPDPNKINFTSHGGSAFCPVSLLKPLLPTVDLWFRSLAVSPVDGRLGQEASSRTSTAALDPLDPAMATAVMAEGSGKALVFWSGPSGPLCLQKSVSRGMIVTSWKWFWGVKKKYHSCKSSADFVCCLWWVFGALWRS